jgi:hypothetical protein
VPDHGVEGEEALHDAGSETQRDRTAVAFEAVRFPLSSWRPDLKGWRIMAEPRRQFDQDFRHG